jgi:D-lyxose ketol-isomerase
MLGWDVTDFGSRDFENIGRTLFTVRNGRLNIPGYPKQYAEKWLIDPEGQRAPAHFHLSKREDIICRAGGNILVQLTKADPDGNPSNESFPVQVDGCTRKLSPGEIVRLHPGESLTIHPRTIHQFWGEEGTGWQLEGVGYTLSSEISSVCDDWNDNVFLVDYGVRFPEIEEDEPRTCFLCNEYPSASRSVY